MTECIVLNFFFFLSIHFEIFSRWVRCCGNKTFVKYFPLKDFFVWPKSICCTYTFFIEFFLPSAWIALNTLVIEISIWFYFTYSLHTSIALNRKDCVMENSKNNISLFLSLSRSLSDSISLYFVEIFCTVHCSLVLEFHSKINYFLLLIGVQVYNIFRFVAFNMNKIVINLQLLTPHTAHTIQLHKTVYTGTWNGVAAYDVHLVRIYCAQKIVNTRCQVSLKFVDAVRQSGKSVFSSIYFE